MKKWLTGLLVLSLLLGGLQAEQANAVSLQLRPLSIRTTLKPNENQKGYLDITNPDARSVTVLVSVQGYRQINSDGELEFYDDPVLKAGILLDLNTMTLGPHQTMRMYYALVGQKLPEGDISAVIFFQTKSSGSTGVVTSARLGTLLNIVNGNPGARQAEITQLSIPFLQFGNTISGSYTIKNTSDPQKGGGFFPDVSLTVQPFEQKHTNTSSLVFPDIERNNSFSFPTNRFGFYAVSATYGSSTKTVWIFVASPAWLIGIAAVAITGVTVWYIRRWRIRRTFVRTRRRSA